MKNKIISLLILSLAGLGNAVAAPISFAPEILVPAYFYPTFEPGNFWGQLDSAASKVKINAIVNPNNGRFESVDSNYATVVDNLRAAGGKVFGYVQSNYGNSRAQVTDQNGNVIVQGFDFSMAKHDVDQYLNLYHVDGFFIDEMSALAAKVPEYADLYSYIKAKGASLTVIGNTGVGGVEASLKNAAADILLNFEGYGVNYASTQAPAWVQNYSVGSFANLAHTTSSVSDMESIVAGLSSHHAGMIYVTDRPYASNPWVELPSYWNQEVAAVAALSAVPEPATYALILIGMSMLIAAMRTRSASLESITDTHPKSTIGTALRERTVRCRAT